LAEYPSKGNTMSTDVLIQNEPEINRGYIKSHPTIQVGNGNLVLTTQNDKQSLQKNIYQRFLQRLGKFKLPFQIALLLTTALSMAFGLWLYRLFVRRKVSSSYSEAIKHVGSFIEQYPLGLYAVVAKSFELAFLKKAIPDALSKDDRVVLEVAIGEGTFSERIFGKDARVIGLDITPESLWYAARMPHVKHAIVCDCLKPPMVDGSFGLIVANNFMHHVSQKTETLNRFSKIAKFAIFNENTPYWSKCHTVPLVLRLLGFKKQARELVQQINKQYLQDLQPLPVLDKIAEKEYNLVDRMSYMSAITYTFAFAFSGIYDGTAPVNPDVKSILLGKKLRNLSLKLTKYIGESLIYFDYSQNRERDVFVSYYGTSKNFISTTENIYLACPRCSTGRILEGLRCSQCSAKYNYIDNMIFLLPKELMGIQRLYSPANMNGVPSQHL
jgi:ubiquinone/menaquinone biosynthesis C-methylase UbiE